MNLLTSLFSTDLPRPLKLSSVVPAGTRPAKRERALGIGYGSSSGYATAARFIPGYTAPRFRFS